MTQGFLSGKKGLVLGVANDRSVAWACAQTLWEQGADLAFNFLGDAQEKRVRKLLEKTDRQDSMCFPMDVTQDSSIEEFFANIRKTWDNIDFVVHSIAFCDRECLKNPFVVTSREQFLQALDVSAYSLIGIAREAQKIMAHGGSIVSMSYLGAERVIPHYNVMGVAKAALEATTRYLAADLGEKGIRVNSISAGPLRTLSSSAIPGIKEMLEKGQSSSPLKRNIEQTEVGKSALYLLSDLSSGVTGEVHHVDAGYNVMGMTQ